MTRNPAVILGVLSTLALTAYSLFARKAQPLVTPTGVFAANDLGVGVTVNLSDLAGGAKGEKLNADQEAIATKLVGQRMIHPIGQGKPIGPQDVRPAPPLAEIVKQIPRGLRGLRVQVENEEIVAAGDFVDVLGQADGLTGTQTIAERILVLSRLEAPPAREKKDGEEGPPAAGPSDTFVLGVTVEQAKRIRDAEKQSSLLFLLRGPQEVDQTEPPPVRVLQNPQVRKSGGTAGRKHAKAREPDDPIVEVIIVKGGVKETVEVPR